MFALFAIKDTFLLILYTGDACFDGKNTVSYLADRRLTRIFGNIKRR